MIYENSVWKNGSRIAQISNEKAVIFKIRKNGLVFSELIELKNQDILFEKGFKPSSNVLVVREKSFKIGS
jgi:hypothetical protein